MGKAFKLFEKILPKTNLRLFFGRSKTLPPVLGYQSKLPVKKSGVGLQNSMTSSEDKYTSSLCASYGIIGAVKGKREFSTDNHILAVKEE